MRISGLLPIYNGEKYIDVNIPLILSNLKLDDELVIVNNGSTDRSLKMLKSWEKYDNRIKLIHLENPGLVAALNLGITECQNNWIARFDIDDRYPANRLELQRENLTKNSVANFSDYEFISVDGKSLGVVPSAVYPPEVSVSLISSQRTAHPSVIFLKEAVLAAGGYRELDFPVEDLSLWLRLSRLGDLSSTPSILLKYMINQGSISTLNSRLIHYKTIDLYRTIGINKNDIATTLLNLKNQLTRYETLTNPGIRKILLMRELVKLMELNQLGDSLQEKQVMILKKYSLPREILQFKNINEERRMLLDLCKRTWYRKKLN
jgi:glycosyltransferase involved in cell wall biosynthesis